MTDPKLDGIGKIRKDKKVKKNPRIPLWNLVFRFMHEFWDVLL